MDSKKLENPYVPNSTWTEEDYKVFKSWIRGVLSERIVTIVFTKKDGTERTMNCTLSPEFLPKVETVNENKDTKPRKASDTSLAVFDVNINEWRSFTYNSIKQVTFTL